MQGGDEGNQFVISKSGDEFFVSDTVANGMTPGAGCSTFIGESVRCPAAGITLHRVDAGGGNDFLVMSDADGVRVEASGGSGDDNLGGGTGADVIQGGDGADRLAGDRGADQVLGGPGNDVITGGADSDAIDGGDGDDELDNGASEAEDAGPDSYAGGPGIDTITLTERTADLRVTLDGAADDGAAGEGDNVQPDVEVVATGVGRDTLIGSAGPNTFRGGSGADSLMGLAGDDALDGGPHDDVLEGGDGNDSLLGQSDNDTLDGGSGTDSFEGDSAVLHAGNDRILARDGVAEPVRCGEGIDSVVVDGSDILEACEQVDAAGGGSTPGGSGGGSTPGDGPGGGSTTGDGSRGSATARGASIAARTIRVRRGAVGVPIACAGPARCSGTVTLTLASSRRSAASARRVKLGSARYRVAAGGRKQVKVKLSRSGRRALRRKRQVTVVVTLASGRSKATRRVTLRVR